MVQKIAIGKIAPTGGGRDREIAPTEDRKRSRSGRSLLQNLGVSGQRIRKSRDREIAPTEEGSGVSGRDGKFGSGGVV